MAYCVRENCVYWLRVHQEAFRLARENPARSVQCLVMAMPALLGASWAAFAWGPEAVASEFGPARGIAAILSTLWIVALYMHVIGRIPSDWDRQKDQLIEALARGRGPWITLSTTSESFSMAEKTLNIAIAVFNPSDLPVRNIFVQLDWFEKGAPVRNLPRKLKPRNTTGPTFDLLPRERKYVEIASLKAEQPSGISLRFIDQRDSDVIGPGTHVIRLKAYGDGIVPFSGRFNLEMPRDADFLRFDSEVIHINALSGFTVCAENRIETV